MYSPGYSRRTLMALEYSQQIFEKYSNIKFHENPLIGCRVVLCGRSDGRTDIHDEANNGSSQFCERALKMWRQIIIFLLENLKDRAALEIRH